MAGDRRRTREREGQVLSRTAAWLFDRIVATATARPDGRLVTTASNKTLMGWFGRSHSSAKVLLGELERAGLIERSGYGQRREIAVLKMTSEASGEDVEPDRLKGHDSNPLDCEDMMITQGNQPFANVSILLVDDQPIGFDLVLRRLGAHVVTCANLEEARQLLLAGSFQVALIDQYLGRQVGNELAVWLYDHQPHVLRISLSGDSGAAEELKQTLPPQKADLYAAYLVKPIGPLEVAAEITRIIDERASTDACEAFAS